MNVITKFLNSIGYETIDKEQALRIQTFLNWYKGFDDEFHQYEIKDAVKSRKYKRYTLGMAKTICEDFATLLLNEKVQIISGFKDLDAVLDRNDFWTRANRLIEITMALGTGAFVEFLDEKGEVVINYIRGDMIYPIAWDDGEIIECAFAGVRSYKENGKGKSGYYVQMHTKDENGMNVIENVYLDDKGKQMPLPEGMAAQSAPSPVPLFQIIKPNIINSLDLDSPMGMSVYGAAIDQLKASDLVFDSYVNEFVLGKKRMYVPQSLASLEMQADGRMRPRFDPSDLLIYVYQQSQDGKDELKPVDMALRTNEHETALQRMIDLLSKRCGLGTGRYRFDRGEAVTATQVVSESSDLYQSLKKHEKPIESAIKGMVNAISYLSGGSHETETMVSFDDSVIEDEAATVQRNTLLVQSGFRTRKRAIMEIERVNESEAEKLVKEIQNESVIGIGDIDVNSVGDGDGELQ